MRTRTGIWRRLLSAVSIFVAVGALRGLRGQSRSNSETAAFTPFVSHEKEQRFSKNDWDPDESTSTYARRSDGSEATRWLSNSPDPTTVQNGQYVIIFDAPRHIQITLEPYTKSVITFHLAFAQVSSRLANEHACDNMEPNTRVIRDSESILGYATIEETYSYPDEKSQTWVATALDCYPLKETTQFSDEVGGHNEDAVLDIREGDPPAAMFSVPAGYTERSPQQVEALYEAKFPGRTLYTPPALNALEQSYEAAKTTQ
jgi:hypothetical protein